MTVGWCEMSFCCVPEYNRCRWGPASLPGQRKEWLRVPWWSEAHARHTAAGQWVQQPLPPNAILGSAERMRGDRKNHREGSLWTGCQGYGWKSARNARKGDRGREDVERWVLRIIRSTVIAGLRYSRTIAWQIRLFLLRKRTSLGQERFAVRTGNNEGASGSSARDQAVGVRHYGRWELTSCNYNITQATISHIQSDSICLGMSVCYFSVWVAKWNYSKLYFPGSDFSSKPHESRPARINSSLRCNMT